MRYGMQNRVCVMIDGNRSRSAVNTRKGQSQAVQAMIVTRERPVDLLICFFTRLVAAPSR